MFSPSGCLTTFHRDGIVTNDTFGGFFDLQSIHTPEKLLGWVNHFREYI